ncbi:Rieske (2Fe-2S) protein [Uliginosibacterium sp. sgz301328]|uniref:Rieske (2Fe-2S) protein n=1 Tax=Uliginosibacterium sp. sgz301328 TaxID=3243764 RepID=UPI00359CEF85
MVAHQQLICASADLVDGGDGVRFVVATDRGEAAAFVVRHEGCAHAYLNRCAHVSVELDWTPGQFFDESGLYLVCATHGALYEPSSGRCVGGPCTGARLQGLAVEERDGAIYLSMTPPNE